MIAKEFFSVESPWIFAEHFSLEENPVQWLSGIGAAIAWAIGIFPQAKRDRPAGCHIGKDAFIHESVQLPPVCVIDGPAYIGEGTTIRPFAYIRGNAIIGKNCLVGNSCELKNSILLDGVQIPHFNYVGDSVLGNFVHLGAGVILANLRLDKMEITARYGEKRIPTGLRKMGAIVGDYSEISCNSVINPGTILPKKSMIFGGIARKMGEFR
ncbi:MAG: UDP-N-acetylglucosamine diphosphorylase [Puniceicoccales bacterium]|jgi:NDP-sugar pyrophosphorylase family protein|nr:UDP-N-acetylglucosamine diphosphorylase [Puniceicoccales bacterium]